MAFNLFLQRFPAARTWDEIVESNNWNQARGNQQWNIQLEFKSDPIPTPPLTFSALLFSELLSFCFLAIRRES